MPEEIILVHRTSINNQMKLKHLLLTILLFILAGLLSACSGEVGAASSWPGVTVSEDTAYLAYNRHVYAIQLSNGNQKWRFPAEPDNRISFYAPPALTPDGQLIVGSYDNVLYSLNPQTGQQNWTFDQSRNRFVASPYVSEKGIFAPDADKNIYALGLDGSLLWRSTTGGPTWAQPVADADCECIYLPSMDHHIYAFSADDGSLRWKTESLGGAVVGTPALSEDGLLYAGTFAKAIVAIDSEDGSMVWPAPADTEGWVWSGPALDGNNLYVGDLNGNFYALDAASGAIRWQLAPEQLDGPIVGTPLILADTIYFNTEAGSLFAVSPQGAIRWSVNIGGSLYTPPVAAGDIILVAPIRSDELLVALTPDGARAWRFVPGN